jgi:hypothetical protein
MDAIRSALLGNSLKISTGQAVSKQPLFGRFGASSLKEELILNQIHVCYQQETVLFEQKFCENRPTAKTALNLA